MAEIKWTKKSQSNLQSIYDYLSNDSEIYAFRFIEYLIKCTAILESQPYLGRKVPEIENEKIREIIRKDYRIVYKVLDKEEIEILAVVHGARDFENFGISKE